MDRADPIRRVSVVSTGQAQIRPDQLASTWRPTLWWLLDSWRWTGLRPINAYVIEHRDGLVLFDAGQDRASVTDLGYFPGGMTGGLYGRLARFATGPTETLTAGLDRLGYAAGDVSTAVLSHLHQDHIGGPADSTAMINAMRQRDPGLVILPAHDPAAASRLARATGQVPTLATV
jgi:N-acyl homoserine lactone hydrolase